MGSSVSPVALRVMPARIDRVLRLTLLLLALALPPMAQPARATGTPDAELDLGKRVALVIGNGAYGALGTLPNPPNDANDIAEALEQLNFDVTLIVDGDVDSLRQSLRAFGRNAAGADVALFYYAGHGMAVRGENYLVPVSAQIETDLDLRFETLGLTDVRETLDFTDAKLKMVILDACRDNPLAKLLQRNDAELGRGLAMSEGLAPMDVAKASGLFIAYATAPGNVALDGSAQRNSPFTRALLDHIDTPNVDVRVMFGKVRADVLRATNSFQTPWTEEAMLGEFQFNPKPEPPAPPTLPTDLVAWNAIASNPDPDPTELEAFLADFPDSTLRGAAQDKLKILRDPANELAAWTALQGTSDIAAYEKFLHRYPQGLYARPALITLQGLMWAQLAAASDVGGMEAFAARFPDAPLTPVVRTTIAQLKAMPPKPEPAPVAAPAPAESEMEPPMAAPAPAPAETEVAEAPPEPEAAAETEMAALAPAPPAASDRALTLVAPVTEAAAPEARPAALVPELDLSPQALETLQREVQPHLVQIALAALGYYRGRIDGQFGGGSRQAARAFQEAIGVPATGTLEPAEVVALMSRAAESGDANAQNIFGGMFQTGAGVRKDPAVAAKWFLRSAEADNGYGQMNLGLLYLNGIGVDEDAGEARRWLEAAVQNGVVEAQAPLDALR